MPRSRYIDQPHRIILLLIGMLAFATPGWAKAPWKALSDGLEIAEFELQLPLPSGNSRITILRIDPQQWDLKILTSKEFGYKSGMSTKEWAQRHQLTAAINAGLFLPDLSTHAGFMKTPATTRSGRLNRYDSLALFSPEENGLPPFRLLDLDEEAQKLQELAKPYRYGVQNLRLIKRPAINRWKPKFRRWSEAALGEDKEGRALFIYCQDPISMHQFNNALLSLPIGIVAAQHLEGGRQAQMYVHHGDYEKEFSGSTEIGLIQKDLGISGWPIPNVIGIVPTEKPAPVKPETSTPEKEISE
jgi:uncharacterized protein YigE (DUF2233 family)